MNLHAVVTGAIGVINPPVMAVLQISTGYNVQPDGTQTPNYAIFPDVLVQVQALTYTDLMKLGAMNIQGIRRACYLNGNIEGIDRQAIKGGDLIQMPGLPDFPGPTTWLVTQSLEAWSSSGWCKVAITLQLNQ